MPPARLVTGLVMIFHKLMLLKFPMPYKAAEGLEIKSTEYR